jgi:hypothetical protein
MFVLTVYREGANFGNVDVFSTAEKAEKYVLDVANKAHMELASRKEIYRAGVHENITLTFIYEGAVVEYEINHVKLDPEAQDNLHVKMLKEETDNKRAALLCAYNLIGEELHELEECYGDNANNTYYINAMTTIRMMLDELEQTNSEA